MKAFELSDVYDAPEEVSRKITAKVPLLFIDHSTEFDVSLDEFPKIVNLFEKYKIHFTDKVAWVVTKDVHDGLGHMLLSRFAPTGNMLMPKWMQWLKRKTGATCCFANKNVVPNSFSRISFILVTGKGAIMVKANLINLRSVFKKLGFLLFVLVLCNCFIGCATPTPRYGKVDFCWTSDHRLPPDERFLSLHSLPETVAGGIVKWVNEKGGEILENSSCDTIVKLQSGSKEDFLIVQDTANKVFLAYMENKYRKWEEGEWEKLQQLTKNQIQFANSDDKSGYCIKSKVGKRLKTVEYREQVGTQTYMHQTYIYTQHGMIPGAVVPVNSPVFQTRKKTIPFFSQIDFFVFNDHGSTKIYAVGVPMDGSSNVKAAYGATIGHKFWPVITGKEEASLIEEAYTYLKDLEQQNKLTK